MLIEKVSMLYQNNQTPLKVIVPQEINSWAETHQKKVMYRLKTKAQDQKRIYPNKEKQLNGSGRPGGLQNNLAVLKAYKQILLKSTAKKMASRGLSSINSLENGSQISKKIKRSDQKQIRSTTQLQRGRTHKAINITQFQPKIENRSKNIQTLQVYFPISNPQKCQNMRQGRKTLIKVLQRSSKNRSTVFRRENPERQMLKDANKDTNKQNLMISRRLMPSHVIYLL